MRQFLGKGKKEMKRDSLNVVLFVFFCDEQVFSSFNEFTGLDHTQNLKVHSKVHFKAALLNVIVPGRNKGRGKRGSATITLKKGKMT